MGILVFCPRCGSENPEGKSYCGNCGSPLDQAPSGPPPTGPRPALKLSVNVLCIVAAIMGVLALFIPWTVAVDNDSGETSYTGAFDFMETDEGRHVFSDTFRYSVMIFLIGTILTFLSPLAGVLQLIGSLGFLMTFFSTEFPGADTIIWIGCVIACVSSVAAIGSLALPPRVSQEPGFRLSRLLAWTVYR